jgi:hypothetical protein
MRPPEVTGMTQHAVAAPADGRRTDTEAANVDIAAAAVRILRIEDGRIHELWDLGQQTPADSPSELGQF